MITAERFRALALGFEGATEAPHVDRVAFRRARIFATLAPDGASANLKLALPDQEMYASVRPDACTPVAGGFGRMGWTTARFDALDETDARALLEAAWRDAGPRPRRAARARSRTR